MNPVHAHPHNIMMAHSFQPSFTASAYRWFVYLWPTKQFLYCLSTLPKLLYAPTHLNPHDLIRWKIFHDQHNSWIFSVHKLHQSRQLLTPSPISLTLYSELSHSVLLRNNKRRISIHKTSRGKIIFLSILIFIFL